MSIVEKILSLMQREHITAYGLEKTLGLSNAAIASWRAGRAKPSADALVKIADYFNVSVDYLLGRSTPAPQPMSEDLSRLVAIYDNLSESNKSRLLAYAEGLSAAK